MSDKKKKKKAAAVAGVMLCLSAWSEAAEHGMSSAEAAPAPVPASHDQLPAVTGPAISLWAHSGRQAQMQARTLMQLKVFMRIGK